MGLERLKHGKGAGELHALQLKGDIFEFTCSVAAPLVPLFGCWSWGGSFIVGGWPEECV